MLEILMKLLKFVFKKTNNYGIVGSQRLLNASKEEVKDTQITVSRFVEVWRATHFK